MQEFLCFTEDMVLEKLQANGPEVQPSTVLAEEVITCTRIDGIIVQEVNEATSVSLPSASEDIPAKSQDQRQHATDPTPYLLQTN